MRLTRKPPTRYWPLLYKHNRGSTSPDQHWLWCASGRGGIELAYTALGMSAGQTILLPEYICDVVLHPLQRLGYIRHGTLWKPTFPQTGKALKHACPACRLHCSCTRLDSRRMPHILPTAAARLAYCSLKTTPTGTVPP